MKVYELKIQVDNLFNSNSNLAKSPVEISVFVSKLVEILASLKDEDEIHPEMMPPVRELITHFWQWVVANLSYDHWKNDIHVIPWLSLQESLVKAGLLAANFHHPILYEKLENYFNNLGNNRLKISELMPLLISASRMLGYKGQTENAYPILRLNSAISTPMPQEIAKIKDIMFLLRSIFYLVYKNCSVEQLALMPLLIYFRSPTTDEEQRSELAIFNWITQNPAECVEWFNNHNDYIDSRSIIFIDALQNITDLLPIKRLDFLRATNRSRWLYPFIQQSRYSQIDPGNNLIEEASRLLELDFATQKDKSLTGVFNFISAVHRQALILTQHEAKVVHSASSLFCLEKYIKHREEDKRNKHSYISFSGETKRHAAEKKQSALRGIPVSLSFFENLATHQGRLKKIINFIEGSPEMDAKNDALSMS